MSQPQFRPNEYLRYLEMSSKTHLLVEGADDIQGYRKLLLVVGIDTMRVIIDGAEQLIELFDSDGNPLGNNQKVESITLDASQRGLDKKLAGCSDRMRQNFAIVHDRLIDIGVPKGVSSNHFFTKGHSIENYYIFEESIRESAEIACPPSCSLDAARLVQESYRTILEVATALTYAAEDCLARGSIPNMNVVFSLASMGVFTVSSGQLQARASIICDLLVKKFGMQPADANRVKETFEAFLAITRNSDVDVLRWACHGHLVVQCFWNSFAICADSIVKDGSNPGRRVLSTPSHLKSNILQNTWLKGVDAGVADFPVDLVSHFR